ncbi:hypothetical protein AALP_AA6G163400 [Arabis alpina]|uniref:Uncharacterized protein n=1 Tax=Arabis alpina TaxID=50452 RepID=A0A087GPM3_ARAAL|nr:hypothetical protein AALP_AA6G163400 [Arabis alpina]
MSKMMILRSLSCTVTASAIGAHRLSTTNRYLFSRSFLAISSSPSSRTHYDYSSIRVMDIGKVRNYSEDVSHMPSDVNNAFKELMAVNWEELPTAVVNDAKTVLSKNSDDKSGKEALMNVFRAAEAVQEFGGILTSLKMELDDSIGMSGESNMNA